MCRFLRWQRGFAISSSAAFGKIGQAWVEQVHRWAKANDIPVHYFAKGENKEQLARPCWRLPPGRVGMAGGAGRDRAGAGVGVALVKAKGHQHAAHPQMEWGRQMAFVNHL